MIINLTQHVATPEQIAQGVVDHHNRDVISSLLTFEEIPTPDNIWSRATALAAIAERSGATAAMIGGAPFFMSALEQALIERGIVPLYAFSRRESVERTTEGGTVVKTNIFRHSGFVIAAPVWRRQTASVTVSPDAVTEVVGGTPIYGDTYEIRANGDIVRHWEDSHRSGDSIIARVDSQTIAAIIARDWAERRAAADHEQRRAAHQAAERATAMPCPICGHATPCAEMDRMAEQVGVRCCSACAEGFVE